MQLTSVSIVGLHGVLSLKVDLNKDITLLVGINGSGKTSVLNVIDWLLKPDMRQLAVATYESLSLSFKQGDISYVLTAAKSQSLVSLSLAGHPVALKPITIKLDRHIDPDDEEATEAYAALGPEKHERPMWNLLKSFPRPTTISLDRSISAESDDIDYIETSRGIMRRRTRIQSPLSYVQQITSEKYAEFRSKAIVNDAELKTEIVVSALQDPDMYLDGTSVKAMTDSEILLLEQKVVAYLTGTVKSKNVENQIRNFFSSSRVLTTSKQSRKQHDLLLDFVTARYRQIERLAKAFNEFEKNNAVAFKALNEYLSAVNRFFRDSNKELYFDEGTGKLVFSFSDNIKNERISRGIAHLSSGERQILILFTYLNFASQTQGVFVVDEPELSLHPKWQHEFMETFLSLRPKGTQLLLATHSPDIVGRYKDACVSLQSARI